MYKLLIAWALILVVNVVSAQDYANDLQDCNREKDEVFIDWTDDINRTYAEKARVKNFNQKKLRSFYCQNLIAKERLETDGYVKSEGSFQLLDDDEKYLVFGIKLGDITYYDKLYIHIGPRQKLASSE